MYADSNFIDERDRGASAQMEQSRAGLGASRYCFVGRPRARVRPLQNTAPSAAVMLLLLPLCHLNGGPACICMYVSKAVGL